MPVRLKSSLPIGVVAVMFEIISCIRSSVIALPAQTMSTVPG